MFVAFQMLQGVNNKCWAGEIAPCVKCFTWPLVKPDTVAPVYDPSMPVLEMGNRDRRFPRKEEKTHLLSKEQICFTEEKSWLVDFILASPMHQLYWRMSIGKGRGLSCWTDKPTNYKQPLLPLNPSSFIQAPFAPVHYFPWPGGNSLTP